MLRVEDFTPCALTDQYKPYLKQSVNGIEFPITIITWEIMDFIFSRLITLGDFIFSPIPELS